MLVKLQLGFMFASHFCYADTRTDFLKRRNHNILSQQRIKLLDKRLGSKIILDGIVHYKTSNDIKYSKWKGIEEVEMDFRRIVAMEGVTYIMKRDQIWRTWRSVVYPNNRTEVICYKCNSEIRENCTGEYCNGGIWTIIETPPPCPFEFYSLIKEDILCGANYTQFKDIHNACPSKIKLSELTAVCDNPIETKWKITTVLDKKTKHKNVICKGKDYCELITTYTVTPNYVVFRIVNESKVILYSKVMKPGNFNYICLGQCGIYNPVTKSVKVNNEPYKLSLLPSKKKRENVDVSQADYLESLLADKNPIAELHKNVPIKWAKNNEVTTQMPNVRMPFLKRTPTAVSSCKKLAEKQKEKENEENVEEDEYNYV